MKKNPKGPLEKAIEKAVCAYAQSLGCLTYKFTSPARRSVPDRLFIMPGGLGCFFIEFKRKGEEPTAAQWVEIEKIRKQGIIVLVIDNIPNGKAKILWIAKGENHHHTPAKVTLADPML